MHSKKGGLRDIYKPHSVSKVNKYSMVVYMYLAAILFICLCCLIYQFIFFFKCILKFTYILFKFLTKYFISFSWIYFVLHGLLSGWFPGGVSMVGFWWVFVIVFVSVIDLIVFYLFIYFFFVYLIII